MWWCVWVGIGGMRSGSSEVRIKEIVWVKINKFWRNHMKNQLSHSSRVYFLNGV